MLVEGDLMVFLLTGIAATLVYAFNLVEEENNGVFGYNIVVCLVCLFMLFTHPPGSKLISLFVIVS